MPHVDITRLRNVVLAGHAGSGKTTIAGLLVRALMQDGHGPVLAVDADPNSCLDVAIGLSAERTMEPVRAMVKEIAETGAIPMVVGGDHSLEYPNVRLATIIWSAGGEPTESWAAPITWGLERME